MFYFIKIEQQILYYFHEKYIIIPQPAACFYFFFTGTGLTKWSAINIPQRVYKEKTYSMLQIKFSN